jgi:hypothetical protein
MDISWRLIINEAQSRNWCKSTVGENQCIARNRQGVGTKIVIEGIQRFFAWTYKDLKGIPPKLAHHRIELDIVGNTIRF